MEENRFYTNYTKYLVKSPIIFYSVLILSIAVFLYLTLTTYIETDYGAATLLRVILTRAGRGT